MSRLKNEKVSGVYDDAGINNTGKGIQTTDLCPHIIIQAKRALVDVFIN
jgi:hypothetical protein